ncbi:hypothetical protein CDAR_525671 [Caerostris darwini]|uniref:Secreted protein n=1 Tax=Caerostris darwini TaxID=1538125 RepID=A0AAV4Q164_9ARAC|nr:hypothetical protein CDAR_525671 [Caerostris darwini]
MRDVMLLWWKAPRLSTLEREWRYCVCILKCVSHQWARTGEQTKYLIGFLTKRECFFGEVFEAPIGFRYYFHLRGKGGKSCGGLLNRSAKELCVFDTRNRVP